MGRRGRWTVGTRWGAAEGVGELCGERVSKPRGERVNLGVKREVNSREEKVNSGEKIGGKAECGWWRGGCRRVPKMEVSTGV